MKKTTFWSATAVDLHTGRREFEERESMQDSSWNNGLFKKAYGKLKWWS